MQRLLSYYTTTSPVANNDATLAECVKYTSLWSRLAKCTECGYVDRLENHSLRLSNVLF